jgi:hypothetical protein
MTQCGCKAAKKCSERRKLIFRQSIRGGFGTVFGLLFVRLGEEIEVKVGFWVLDFGLGGGRDGGRGRRPVFAFML